MQTILGSNGVIGKEIANTLSQFTNRIRLVSRNPKMVRESDEIFPANLLDSESIIKAVNGSEIVFLTAGLTYNIKTWRNEWPVLMRNVINACKQSEAKLVFFDNVYLYGRVKGWMTENTQVNPVSRKGEVRAGLVKMIWDEVEKGNLKALIARSADFYGPNTPLSFVDAMVFQRLRKGKKAQWFMNDKVKHSFTYTPDAGKATALLGNTDSAYNQTWHLPTDKNALTGKEFIEKAAIEFGTDPKYMLLREWMVKVAGLFNGNIKESVEMLYQNDSEYLFDSSKFNNTFSNFKTTTYDEGINETVMAIKDNPN